MSANTAISRSRSHEMIKPGFDEVDYLLKRRGTELVLTKNLE